MAGLLLNPGAGPLPEAVRVVAMANAKVFVDDIRAAHGYTDVRLVPGEEKDGRWSFRLTCDGDEHDLDMPGLPLAQVRYTGHPQNPFDYPRLYVDGSSWLWKFAVNMCTPSEEDPA